MLALDRDRFAILRNATIGLAIMAGVGMALIWARSEAVGTPAIGKPVVGTFSFRILEREETGRPDRPLRILISTQIAPGQAIRARMGVDRDFAHQDLAVGATGTARMRLIAPSRAVVPGAYDPARAAWFEGVSAVGTFMGKPEMSASRPSGGGGGLRERLGNWVADRIVAYGGSSAAAAIAETLVTGNRTGLAPADIQAMRDAGLAHLLSISGLHVGAVIAVCWFVAMRGLALFPALALRIPLPLAASTLSAGAGIGYTLLTGAELPTIRACIAAILVLLALALGRRALSLRLIAVAAIAVLMFWPEAAVSPSFQMSFAAVVAIVALHNARPVERWREQARSGGFVMKWASWLGLLFVTGIVVELTLMPLVLFHFHRTGIYGSLVNLVAIPLTTVVVMPALGIAMLLDMLGLGAPAWWVAGLATDFVIDLARFAASRPGAVILTPVVPLWPALLCCAGGFWLALWSGRTRLYGVVPFGLGLAWIMLASAPDVLIAGDGRQVIVADGDDIYRTRDAGRFDDEAMYELMGTSDTQVRNIRERLGTSCLGRTCTFSLNPDKGLVRFLIVSADTDSHPADLAAMCAGASVVVSPSLLPEDCRPQSFLIDAKELSRQGGAAIDLDDLTVRRARPDGDRHGW